MNLTKIINIFFLLLSFTTAFEIQAETNITFAYENVDSFPWTMKDGSGIDLIMLGMVDETLPEVSFNYTPVPWKRCLHSVETGKTEGCFTASFSQKRLQYGYFPGTHTGGKVDKNLRLHSSSYSLYVLNNTKIDVIGKLKISGITKTIAAPFGYSIASDLKKAGYIMDTSASKTDNNFKKLLIGRVEAVAALTLNGNNILASNTRYSDNIREIKTPLVNKPYYLMLSKQFMNKNRRLAEKIWHKIPIIRESQAFKDKATEFLSSQ